jgi:hypothetical protein
MPVSSHALAAALALAAATMQAIAADSSTHATPSPTMTPATLQSANGPFDVQLTPEPPAADAGAAGIGRMTIAKQFHGTLEATSTGEMLAFVSPVDGSAGYVAMETVRGTLAGRRGSFVLQHSATMTRGAPAQSITVVPDSGTDALVGLAGRMRVDVAADGAHAYRFEFTLPGEAP